MSRIKPYTGFATLLLAVFLWLKAVSLKEVPYKMVERVQVALFHKPYTAETVVPEATLIVAMLYAAAVFLSVVLMCASLTSLLHGKPLVEAGRKQMYRYFAFFGLLPLVVTSLAWDFIWPYLPAKTPSLISEVMEIKPILHLTATYDGALLYITVLTAVVLWYLFAYGVGVNANIWFDIVCGVLWFFYVYDTLYVTTAYIEYGIWFLLFVLACYTMLGVIIVISKYQSQQPLLPQYEMLVFSLHGEKEEDDDTEEDEEDFSLFMPSKKDEVSLSKQKCNPRSKRSPCGLVKCVVYLDGCRRYDVSPCFMSRRRCGRAKKSSSLFSERRATRKNKVAMRIVNRWWLPYCR